VDNVTAVTGVTWVCEVANVADGTLYEAAEILGEVNASRYLEAVYPQTDPEAYLVSPKEIYTMDHGVTIFYKIKNLSNSETVDFAGIDFDFSLFPTGGVSVTSARIADDATYITLEPASNQIWVNYAGSGQRINIVTSPNNSDTLTITAAYDLGATTTMDLNAHLTVGGLPKDAVVPASETVTLGITRSEWGRVTGTVVPGNVETTVKFYYPGTRTTATNRRGATLVYSGQGFYLLDFIVPTAYDIACVAPGYIEQVYVSNYNVAENLFATVSTITLQWGTLTGVIDPSGLETLVTLYEPGTAQKARYTGGAGVIEGSFTGTYRFDLVPVGAYDVGFRGAGFFDTWISNVGMEKNRSVVTNVSLDWNALVGGILPSDAQALVTLYVAGTPARATYAGATGVSGTIEGSVAGAYDFRLVPPGTYDVSFAAPGFLERRYVGGVTTVKNATNRAPTARLKYDKLERSLGEQARLCLTELSSRLVVQDGSHLPYEFIANLYEDSNASDGVGRAARDLAGAQPFLYELDLETTEEQDIPVGVGLSDDALLTLACDPQAMAANDWQASSLAVYFYDGLQWRELGGEVNSGDGTVTVRVNYLYRRYAVFPSAGATGPIHTVVVNPPVYTPDAEDERFSVFRMHFLLATPRDEVLVKIYDLSGQLTAEFTADGSTGQAGIVWDGNNPRGVRAKPGLYLYRIEAGGDTFSGTFLLVR
jgi:hypothetical protein